MSFPDLGRLHAYNKLILVNIIDTYSYMSFFDSLLKKRGLDHCPRPLWKLKLTENEFEELRILLERQTHEGRSFITVFRECTLFFAEYWRRLYVSGAHSIQMVYDALNSTNHNVNRPEEFYNAACHGAKMLNIERYDGGRADHLNDMLYQGGLPMKLVTANVTNSVWDRFIRGLINRRINFEELNLGVVAAQSKSLREYCEQLIRGIETECPSDMPFYCQSENDAWFLYLKELAKQEKIRCRQLHPYSLLWEFRIDTVEKKIYTKYVVKGLQRLPKAFLEEQGLDGVPFFSVQVRKNGHIVDTFDYANNFCRYTVASKHSYKEGDSVSLFLHNQEEPLVSDILDMSVPHLLYRNKDGIYELGNQLGKHESFLLIPESWEVENSYSLEIQDYTWGERSFSGIQIPAEFVDNIIVKGEDGEITFGINSALYWTEMQSHPLYGLDIIEPVYNANSCRFKLCYDTDNGINSMRCKAEFRSKYQSEWSDTPAYGEIFARAIDKANFVTPICFINVGDGLVISLQNADQDTCQIKVSWSYGNVSTTEGKRIQNEDSVWEIKKENCQDPRKIRFTFTPELNSHNQFTLSVKAPFKDFSIMDIYGNKIESDSWIPYSDIDMYQYHLVGQNIEEYSYGNINRQLRWIDNKLYIFEGTNRLKEIPYEGSLLTLFDSREALRSLLERTSQNIVKAEIKVQFMLNGGQQINFSIKESPFRPRQNSEGCVVITGKNQQQINYTGVLKLIKLGDPYVEPIEMRPDVEKGYYILPEEIRPWGKTILIGRTRGRICPALVDLTKDMDDAYRATNRIETIETIRGNMQNSTLADNLWKRILGWFEKAQEYDIPASSILELSCTGQDYKSLLCLAFVLYVKCKDNVEKDILKEKLKTFSRDLAFQWYWLQPYLDGIFNQLSPFIADPNSQAMQEIYINWAMSYQGEKMIGYLSALNTEAYMDYIGKCLMEVLTLFTDWLKDLCISSMTETYDSNSQEFETLLANKIIREPTNMPRLEIRDELSYIENNQEPLGEETTAFFNNYSELNKTGNELWLYQRVNAVVAHLQGHIDLFSQSDEIRRSIIYCSKSSNQHFILSLYKKLSHRL